MSTQQIQCDAKLVIGGKASGMLKGMGKMLAREAVVSGYGAIADTDVGYVATHVYDGYETLRSLAAPQLMEEARHSAFAVFRDAIADGAENPVTQVANGQSFTNFYGDLLEGHKVIEADILTSSPDSIDAKLDYSSVDWNDPTARAAYLQNIQDYSQQVGLRDHAGFSAGRPGSSSDELKILLHTSSREEYTAYIQRFEGAIQENFQRSLSEAQSQAEALGYTGSMTDTRAMEKFAATLSDADKGTMQHLIQLTDGKVNKVDQFILARISSGEININDILNGNAAKNVEQGVLNGVKLDDNALKALAALNVYANSDAVANAYQLKYLERIGGTSSIDEFDLSKLKCVNARISDFEKALTDRGFGAWQNHDGKFQLPQFKNKHGKIKAIDIKHMSLKQLRMIDLSKIQDKDIKEALKQYINLREHGETLKSAQELMQNMQMRLTQLTRKILGDSDLSQAIGQLQSQYRNVQYAIKIWGKLGDFVKWAGKFAVKNRLWVDKVVKRVLSLDKTNGAARYQRYLQGKHSGASKEARYKAKQADKAKKAASKKDAAKAAKEARINKLSKTKKGQKKLAKEAKRAQKKLLRKAGKQGSDLVRSAGRLAKHGVQGTTAAAGGTGAAAGASGTAAAGASGTAAAGGTSAAGAAGGAAGGASAGVVLFWIIIIALIVSAVCQIISGFINIILTAVTDFNDSLIGKAINFISNWTWPWEATDEEKQNVLYYTMYQLMQEDYNSKQATSVAGQTFYSGCYATVGKNDYTLSTEDDEAWWHQYAWDSTSMTADNTYYLYTNAATGEPINEYTTIKLCLSMAHAFTCEIQYDYQIDDFSTYAVGLWHHLNKSSVSAVMTLCPGCLYGDAKETFTYEYDCDHDDDESSFYTRFWEKGTDRYYASGTSFTVSAGSNQGDYAKLYIVTPGLSHEAMRRTESGCVQYTHNNKTGKYFKYDSKSLGNGTSSWVDAGLVQLSAVNSEQQRNLDEITSTNTSYYDANGYRLSWQPNPKGVQDCFNKNAEWTLSDNDSYEFCTPSTSKIADCNNQTAITKYKQVTSTKYCGTKYSGGSSINDGDNYNRTAYLTTKKYENGHTHTEREYIYYCEGHSADHPCYCASNSYAYYTRKWNSSTQKYEYKYAGIIKNASKTNFQCSKKTSQYVYVYESGGYVGKYVYTCSGHTNHGYFTDDSTYYATCRDWVYYPEERDPDTNAIITYAHWEDEGDGYARLGNSKYYFCQGYSVTNYEPNGTLNVCLGHLKCDNENSFHWTCPGHDFNYCAGHMKYYIERKTTMQDSDAIYLDTWRYTVNGKFLWWETSTTYGPVKDGAVSGVDGLARKDWVGWTEDNIELMHTMLYSDWYQKYDIGMGMFNGSQCSPVEKLTIFNEWNVNENSTTEILMANLDVALDACGKVPYYPNGRAYYAGMDPNNKFNSVTTEVYDVNHVRRAVKGLDPKYFADWIYRSTHNNATCSALTNWSQCDNPVIAQTNPGMPIVNYSDSNNIRTGILIGVYTNNGVSYVKYVGIDTGTPNRAGWVTIIDEPMAGWYYSVQAQT